MPRKPTIEDLSKRFDVRFLVFTVFISAWLFVDELIKEGYIFDFRDVGVPGTHEFLVVVLLSLNLILWMVRYAWQRLRDGRQ